MNRLPIVPNWERRISALLAACAGIHLSGDFLLIRKAWFFETNDLLIAMALPLSQCSLVAIWAASSRAILALRFAVPGLVAIFCWYVLSQILPWGIGEPASAAWAIAVMIQIIAIVILIRLYRLIGDVMARRSPDSSTAGGPSQLSFDLATLMLWLTVSACGFGFMQFGRDKLGWDASVANWECLHAMPVIAIFNAVLAALWLWSLTLGCWQWRVAKAVLTAVVIACSCSLLSRLVGWIAGNCSLEHDETRILLTAQSLLLIGTLTIIVAGIHVTKPDAGDT
jgi:hypothetical protein